MLWHYHYSRYSGCLCWVFSKDCHKCALESWKKENHQQMHVLTVHSQPILHIAQKTLKQNKNQSSKWADTLAITSFPESWYHTLEWLQLESQNLVKDPAVFACWRLLWVTLPLPNCSRVPWNTSMKGNVFSPGRGKGEVTPGLYTINGTRVATSKLLYLAHSPCSPNDQPKREKERVNREKTTQNHTE